MHISPINTYQPYFKSGNTPEYRIEPFYPKACVRKPDAQVAPTVNCGDKTRKMRRISDDDYYKYDLDPRGTTEFSIEDDGLTYGPYTCDADKLSNRTIKALQKQRRIPDIMTFANHKPTRGIVVVAPGLSNIPEHYVDEPIIFVDLGTNGEVVGSSIPQETTGYIAFPGAFDGRLSHGAQRYKHMLDQVHLLIKEDDRKELLKYKDQLVEVGVKDGRFYVKPVDKNGKLPEYPKIDIPQLDYCDKILTSKECTQNVIGNKAVNLRKLEKMAEEGKINAVIPPFIALPEGFLKYFSYEDLYKQYGFELVRTFVFDEATPEQHKLFKHVADAVAERNELFEKCGNRMFSKLIKTAKENSVDGTLILRSCNNDEDRENFSNAGSYTSKGGFDFERYKKFGKNAHKIFIWNLDYCVLASKYHNGPRELRKAFHIPEEDIQVGVIVQKEILTDKKFTIYTDDGTGDLKIDLKIEPEKKDKYDYNRVIFSHMFTYHRDTGELTYDSMQTERYSGATYDMDGNMKELDPANDLSDDKELFELLKSAAEDAIRVEEEFGAPQDIEGGLKDGQVYFWQSRNIVR